MHRQTPLKVELFASALRKIILGVLAVFACLILLLSHNPVKTSAATNGTLNFQARLESNTGAIAPDGTYNVQFKLYDASTGGTNLWTESYLNSASQGVIVTNGYLTVNLGSITSFPTTINWDQSLYVTMNIGGTSGTASWDGEMNPRLKLTAVPYAFQAKSASQLQQIQGAYSGTLNFNTLTDNRTISLPDENGTVCLQTSTSCGFLTTSAANSSYIQLQGTTPGTAQTGNFNISGTGIAATLQGTSAVLSPLFDTPTTGVLNIGTTNATAINLNKNVTVISNQKLSLGGALAYQSSSGGAISFAAPVTYSANQARYASETDFNNDGYNDIVTADVQNNLAYVFINNGDGTFKTPVTYGVGGYPEWIGYADVNKDGFQDIISSNAATNNVSVLINKGDGTFYSAATYAVGSAPKSANAVDVNNDGYPDLVVSNSNDNNVSVLMNNGNGTFASAVNYSLPASSAPKYAAIVDVNGDGHPDIVTANSGTNNVSVLLNSGSGTFGSPVNYAVGTNPRSAKVVDLNHDGHPDIVAVNATDHTVSILLNNGNGTFATQTTYDVGSAGYPIGVDVADINGDGNVDIITANSGNNTISIFPGNGDGTFGSQTLISSGEPRSMNVADVNNDGRLDIVAPDFSGNNVAVLINTTTMVNHSSILSVNTGSAGNTGLIIQGNTGQVADLLRLQTTGGSLLFSVKTSGNGAFAGTVSGANAVNTNEFVTLGQATSMISASSSSAVSLQLTTPGTAQTGNFNISGTGIAATLQGTSAVLSPLFDTPTTGVLNIGTTNATAINLNKNVTVAAGQYISLVGGITSTRPASPTAGMLYYDTTTNRLLVYSNSKWQADRSTATKIVADGSTSQNPDSADFVVPAASTSAQTIINNAIAALPASGGTVYLAEGAYTVSGSINLPSNVTLAGAGAATVIKQANGTNLSVGLIQNSDSTNGNDHITIRDLKLDGNKTNQTSGSANGVKFVKVGAGSTTVGAHLLNLWVENFTDVGYQLNNSSRLTVTGVSAHFNNNNGLSLSGTNYSTVTGSNLSDNTNSLASGIVLSSAAANNTINGNVLNDNGNGGVVLAGGSTGNTISDNTITDNRASSVGINSSNGNTVSGNIIKSSGTNGIRISTGSENLIDSNLVADSGQTAAGSDAIELVNTSLNNTVSNNKLSDTAGTGEAIIIDALSTGNILIANSIGTGTNGVWNSSGPISDAAAGTIYKSQTDVNGNNRSSSAKTSGFFQSANSANNTDATIVSRVQGSATADLIQAQDSTGNALFKVSSTGTVTVGKTNTTGTLIVNSASGGTITLAAGATASGSSYQLTLPTAIGSASQCLSVASAASGVAQLGYANCITTVTTTLQNAYDNSTSPATVLLGDAKNFVITAADTATDPSILLNLQCVTSCGSNGRFAVQNAGTDVMAVNPNGTVVVGSAANGITLSANGVTLTGSARQAKIIQLMAEYAGAVLDTGATGNNTGTMTSGYDMTARINYYKWTTTQTSPQSYDIVTQIPIPSDFDSWNGALSFNVYTSDVTNGTIKAQVINSSGGTESGCNFVNITPGSTNTWSVNSSACTLSSGSSYVAGDYFTLRLRLQSPQGGNVRVGNVLIYYKNKF